MRDFDRIARAYRWLEYLTFGRALQRCRNRYLDRLAGTGHVLVLGDGDGRFTAALLACHCQVFAVAVDQSPAMLAHLWARVRAVGASPRLIILQQEAVSLLAEASRGIVGQPAEGFDCVCSHFFLDCLSTAQVHRLVEGVRPRLAPGALWIVSEFATPTLWTRWVVGLLYRGFSLLTGLQTQQLPAWRETLASQGFACVAEEKSLRGLLSSSVWQWRGSGAGPRE